MDIGKEISETKEIVIITFISGRMLAVDNDKALNEIVGNFNSITDIQIVEHITK